MKKKSPPAGSILDELPVMSKLVSSVSVGSVSLFIADSVFHFVNRNFIAGASASCGIASK